MPSIQENRSWGKYSWPEQGDEWSRDWGDAETQWFASIFPRIHRFFPAPRVLEIAPGYGRWSGFLIGGATEYIGIDLNNECISACRDRFSAAKHATFVVNDGTSLAAVRDNSIDFAFSFDSLVHCEIDVIEAYLVELSHKLSPNGVAFLHHSNLGEFNGALINLSRLLRIPSDKWRLTASVLRRLQLSFWDHWRAPSVTAQKVADTGRTAGLACVGQEVINWGRHNWRLVDCLSTLTRFGSRWERQNVVVRNSYFMAEARSAHVVSRIYASIAAELNN